MRDTNDEDEIELVFYSDGSTYFAGISNRICVQQIMPVCKSKRKDYAGKFFVPSFRYSRLIARSKKDNNAYSNDRLP